MCEVKSCLECKKIIPCHKKAEKREMVICNEFVDMYPDDDGTPTMEEIQALNASIPEDEITVDLSGIEVDEVDDFIVMPPAPALTVEDVIKFQKDYSKEDVNPCEHCTLCGE